jgi:hypothetical protein
LDSTSLSRSADGFSLTSLPPRRIPRIIHQTGRTTTLTYKQHSWRATWAYYNPEWEMRFYDDAGCEAFVAHEFPGGRFLHLRPVTGSILSLVCSPDAGGETSESGRPVDERLGRRADRAR